VLIGQNRLVQWRVAAIGAIENAEALLNGAGGTIVHSANAAP
jgi:hypothetical protein